MKKYKQKPVFFNAVQWFKNGDHPDVDTENVYYGSECASICAHCGKTLGKHGKFKLENGGDLLCPGDWVLQDNLLNKLQRCSDKNFKKLFEEVG